MAVPPIPPSEAAAGTREPAPTAPSSGASPPQGETTIDDALIFETQALAHHAAGVLAIRIAERVRQRLAEETPCQVVFLDEELALALSLVRSFRQQCEVLEKSFDSAAARARTGLTSLGKGRRKPTKSITAAAAVTTAAAAVTAVTGTVSAAVNLLGFFAVDTRYFGRDAEVSQQALVMELARHLGRTDGISFRWPTLVAAAASREASRPIPSLGLLSRVAESREKAAAVIQVLADGAYRLADDDPRLPAARLALDRSHATYDSASAVLDEIRDSFFRAGDGPRTSTGYLLQIADDFLRGGDGSGRKDDPNDEGISRYFLTARVEAAGGSYRTRRHLFQLFTGDRLSYSGGCIVSFALLDGAGNFLTSGLEQHREPFRSD